MKRNDQPPTMMMICFIPVKMSKSQARAALSRMAASEPVASRSGHQDVDSSSEKRRPEYKEREFVPFVGVT